MHNTLADVGRRPRPSMHNDFSEKRLQQASEIRSFFAREVLRLRHQGNGSLSKGTLIIIIIVNSSSPRHSYRDTKHD